MGKYLFIVAVLGVYIYSYMELPKDIQAATQFEIVQLHNPLMPLPDTVAMQEKSVGKVSNTNFIVGPSAEVANSSY